MHLILLFMVGSYSRRLRMCNYKYSALSLHREQWECRVNTVWYSSMCVQCVAGCALPLALGMSTCTYISVAPILHLDLICIYDNMRNFELIRIVVGTWAHDGIYHGPSTPCPCSCITANTTYFGWSVHTRRDLLSTQILDTHAEKTHHCSLPRERQLQDLNLVPKIYISP